MKKKVFIFTFMFCVVFLFLAITIYAAFTMTHNYETSIEYHEIQNAQLSSSVENAKVSFTNPGDKINISYELSNLDNKDYCYYYLFNSNSLENVDLYLDMVYVYQNGIYCGVLKDFLFETEFAKKKELPINEYIFSGEKRKTIFTFELHNDASSYKANDLNIEFDICVQLSTINVQKNIFANSSTVDFAVADLNQTAGKTLIIKEDISTSIAQITKDCTIDLCGNNLTLSGTTLVADGVNVNIIDSRGGGAVLGSGFSLGTNSFIEANASISKIDGNNYNKALLQEKLSEIYRLNNVVFAKEDYDLFGYYSVYNLTASSDDVEIENGIIKSQQINVNKVISVTIAETEYEFKYVGNDYSIFQDILENKLTHMIPFMDYENSIQVANDIFLPTSINEYNATISWNSSNHSVISNDGIVQKAQGNVILTATIKVFDKIFVQDYYVYIVQPDNLSKLQYLVTKVEQGITLNGETPDTSDDIYYDVIISAVGQSKYLPICDPLQSDPYHYTVWTDGLKLGITDISYSVEGAYQYIELNQTLDNLRVTEASVNLKNITYSKAARVMITATFDNGEILSSYITIIIDLGEGALADEVYRDVQNHLNSVDVLENILASRKENGTLKETGDFLIPSKIDVINLKYDSLEPNLYEIQPVYEKDENGQETDVLVNYKVHFIDLRYLSLTNKSVRLRCTIIGEEEEEISSETLYFRVPGALTPLNFVVTSNGESTPIIDLSNANQKRIFYSIKLQVLQQSDYPYYQRISNDEMEKLIDVTDYNDIYNLGQYILMYDIDNTERLMFEYSAEPVIIDYYDLKSFENILAWATGDEVLEIGDVNSVASIIDSNLQWISSDGNQTISDGEIAVIFSYAERYPGFSEFWSEVINTLDNTLDEDDISKLLEKLAQDKCFVSILNWIEDEMNIVPLYQWLLLVDSSSPYYDASYIEITEKMITELINATQLPSALLNFSNGTDQDNLNIEERVIHYYVLANHPDKYPLFANAWQDAIHRQNSMESFVKKIQENTPNEYSLNRGNNKQTLDPCYDPIFTDILNWAFQVNSSDSNHVVLSSALGKYNYRLFFENNEESYINSWHYRDSILGDYYGDILTVDEWKVIATYLNGYRIENITYLEEDYYISPSETDNAILTSITNKKAIDGVLQTFSISNGLLGDISSISLVNGFLNYLISLVNAKYSQKYSSFNELVDWAKSEVIEIKPWNEVVENYDISGLDDYLIKDATIDISYDEFLVLEEFMKSQMLGGTTANLQALLLSHYVGVNMEFDDDEISSQEKTNILSAINETALFDTIVEEITNLGSSNSSDLNLFDNLETLSYLEVKRLAEVYKNDSQFIAVLNSVITAYQVSVSGSGEEAVVSVSIVTSAPYDRLLLENEVNVLKELLGKKLNFDNNSVFKHITLSQISEAENEVFSMVTYFSNLRDISFRGTSSTYLFETNKDANITFSIIALGCSSIEKLTMNYCGVNDISTIRELVNLTYLDLRSNYSKDEYKGLEDISHLIHLNDVKNNNNAEDLLYVNVFDTDVTSGRAEVVLGTLYTENENAELWFDLFGVETQYPFEQLLTNDKIVIYALSLLYELNRLSGDYIMLPNYVYRYDGTDVVQHEVTWKVVIANSLVKITAGTSYKLLERIDAGSGSVTISASISYEGYTHTRYFVIEVV